MLRLVTRRCLSTQVPKKVLGSEIRSISEIEKEKQKQIAYEKRLQEERMNFDFKNVFLSRDYAIYSLYLNAEARNRHLLRLTKELEKQNKTLEELLKENKQSTWWIWGICMFSMMTFIKS